MHILIAATGSYGDVYPFVGLGRALKARGHEVELCTNEHFRHAAEAEGLGFAAAGSAELYDETVRHPDLWHPTRGIRIVFGTVTRYLPLGYEVLSRHYRKGETLLVASTLSLGARVLQETSGGKLVSVHLAPNVFRSDEDAMQSVKGPVLVRAPKWVRRCAWWLADRVAIDPMIAPALNEFRRQFGLAPVRRVFRDWIHSPDRVIALFPDWFAPKRPGWPEQTRLVGFPLYDAAAHEPLPDDLERFLGAGDAPVLFAAGSANTNAREFFETSLAACERTARRAVFVSRYGSQIPGELPDWARHFDYLPFSKVLPRCSAFVSHGGIGSVSQGFRAGVPQIIRAMGFDQFENGWRAEQLGVAKLLPARKYAVDTVLQALTELASAACARACRDVAERFSSEDALEVAAAIIESVGAS
jgi:UDP:flavonoid glycosyltransferase YjiC (YdhE family)